MFKCFTQFTLPTSNSRLITGTLTSVMLVTTLLTIVGVFPEAGLQAQQPNQTESEFAKRMMTLDKNKDGFLTSEEVPKSVLSRMATADLNGDGKWSPQELSSISQAAMDGRTKAAAEVRKGTPAGRGRAGRGRMGRGPARPDSGPGSPLDKAQILKFALTFDSDKDGGLNAAELNLYAAALAGRRARARQQREAESPTARDTQTTTSDLPKAEERTGTAPSKETSGLKSKANARNSDPFGNGSDK